MPLTAVVFTVDISVWELISTICASLYSLKRSGIIDQFYPALLLFLVIQTCVAICEVVLSTLH